MTTSVVCKPLHVSPPLGPFEPDQVNGAGGDQGPADCSEFSLMEMTEVEHKRLQHIIQDMDILAADRKFNQPSYSECNLGAENSRAASSPPSAPSTARVNESATLGTDERYAFSDPGHRGPEEAQEIGLVLCSSEEKTPTTCVEVPNSVLAKVKYAKDRSVDPCERRAVLPPHLRPVPSARACLEMRFNCSPSEKNRQQEAQAAVPNTFLSMLHHSVDTQGIALLSQSDSSPKAERIAAAESAYPYGETFLVTHVQGLGPLLDDCKQPETVFPKNFSFSYRPDKAADPLLRAPYIIQAEEQVSINLGRNWKQGCVGPGCKRVRRIRPSIETSQRRERHNNKERDRRRRIRLCCDELNLLVPFCSPETDKATTLQWTTAFLKYIKEVYGDSLKQEFENTFCGKTGVRLKPSSAAVLTDITESRILV